MTEMRGWSPGSPPVKVGELVEVLTPRRVAVFHFWAIWNGVDRLFEPDFRIVREEFADRVEFRSVDVDDPELVDFCRECEMTNVPSLAGFVHGRRVETLVGRRSIQALRDWIDGLLARASKSD